MKKINIGVLALQGDVSEHVFSLTKALKNQSIQGAVIHVRQKKDIDLIDALIIPGGESTAISNILVKSGLHDVLSRRIEKHTLPIMGTCAGSILLAKKLKNNPQKIQILNAIDIEITRNAFGRQNDSFEKLITFNNEKIPYNAIFIRAPIITKFWGSAISLAKVDKETVAVRQNEFLALSFHPELTSDLRIHEYFLKMVL